MPIRRQNQYKPLLFTTTLRNPERLKGMLALLKKFDGRVLTNELAEEIVGELIRAGLYKPVNVSAVVKSKWKQVQLLSDEELAVVMRDNPQNHKEAGFDKGWPSRFDTYLKIAKELGFVYYNMGEQIKFSQVGLKLADTEHPEFEQQAFLNAFAKYQRKNPLRRVSNENAPLILLLQVIKKLNADSDFNGAGITKLEIPLLLTWRDNDAEALYQKIKAIRAEHSYDPSWEVILREADALTGGRHASKPDKTIMLEYPDDFLRKMRLTGLITVRGYGQFIDINKKEEAKVNYVIEKYAQYDTYSTEREYFDYISTVDEQLISIERVYETSVEQENQLLQKWINHFSWDTIKGEILKLTTSSPSSSDEVLALIPSPLRLEFLTSLAVLSRIPSARVKPNYISDDEGLPSSHAPGNGADIECYENEETTLLEVTLLNGAAQVSREMPPISRHLESFRNQYPNTVTFFIAPNIHQDTVRWAAFIKHKDGLDIYNFSIKDFIAKLDEGVDRLNSLASIGAL
ncbi:MAG: AlwI family type II restriction endonuclease [Patescibacteria group bacterium]